MDAPLLLTVKQINRLAAMVDDYCDDVVIGVQDITVGGQEKLVAFFDDLPEENVVGL